jgi:hypothetical protein
MSFAPTISPTYGPSSDSIVSSIFVGTLGGIISLIVIYFLIGNYTYIKEIQRRMERANEILGEDFKEKTDDSFPGNDNENTNHSLLDSNML